jgi:hypothetical protein
MSSISSLFSTTSTSSPFTTPSASQSDDTSDTFMQSIDSYLQDASSSFGASNSSKTKSSDTSTDVNADQPGGANASQALNDDMMSSLLQMQESLGV